MTYTRSTSAHNLWNSSFAALLGVDELIQRELRKLKPGIAYRRLIPVAQTKSGEGTVVDLRITVQPNDLEICWLAVIVEPERYQDFISYVDDEVALIPRRADG